MEVENGLMSGQSALDVPAIAYTQFGSQKHEIATLIHLLHFIFTAASLPGDSLLSLLAYLSFW